MDKKNIDYMSVAEYATFKRLITDIHPTGAISIVSDTFSLWSVLINILPRLKDIILNRNGKLVIRPDSGDPVRIICGYAAGKTEAERKGVCQLLWETFGGTITDKGYKLLDSHVGIIYGDSINIPRAVAICEGLKAKGFASQCVYGIGSFTYQYNTRDTFGTAMKATYVEIGDEQRNIYKNPITDDGEKQSAKGLLAVYKNENDKYYLVEEVSWEQEGSCELKTVFKDGKLTKDWALSEIRNNLYKK